MTFQESIRVCFTKYADFTGTASRPEYWWFVLFLFLAGAGASVVGFNGFFVASSLGTVFSLATALPFLAAGARRLHDTGHSGWLQLMFLVPVAGFFIVAVYMSLPGKPAAATPGAGPRGEQTPARRSLDQ